MVMRTWQRGRTKVAAQVAREERTVDAYLAYLRRNPPAVIPGCAVFMSSHADGIPRTLMRNLRHNGALHEHTVLMTVVIERVPRVLNGRRVQVTQVAPGLHRVVARVGFMEQPSVPKLLHEAERQGLGFRTDRATYYLGRDDVVIGLPGGMSSWRKHLFLFLSRNAQFAGAHFGIAPERVMEVGGQVQV
jgi:KUP system potassium uptake protein